MVLVVFIIYTIHVKGIEVKGGHGSDYITYTSAFVLVAVNHHSCFIRER
jgi:hypothetical protein